MVVFWGLAAGSSCRDRGGLFGVGQRRERFELAAPGVKALADL